MCFLEEKSKFEVVKEWYNTTFDEWSVQGGAAFEECELMRWWQVVWCVHWLGGCFTFDRFFCASVIRTERAKHGHCSTVFNPKVQRKPLHSQMTALLNEQQVYPATLTVKARRHALIEYQKSRLRYMSPLKFNNLWNDELLCFINWLLWNKHKMRQTVE